MSDDRAASGRMMNAYIRQLVLVADFCHRRAMATLVCAMLISAGCIAYSWTHMAISTASNALLSDHLPFTHAQTKFEQAFPGSGDAIVLILDGDTADIAASGADRLEAWLGRHHDAAEHVFALGANQFFRKNGLLYMDVDDLAVMTTRLADMQPMLARLAQNPGLTGLASLVEEALKRDVSGDNKAPAELGRVLDAWGAAIEAAKQQRFFIFPWQEIMMGVASSKPQRRRIIEITPHMNDGEIQPAEQSIDLIKQGIHELKLDPAHGMRVRMTGEAVLDYEQLQGAMRAAGLATGLACALILVLLFIALKDTRLVLAVTLTLAMSLLWTTAFALFATAPLNLISISFAVLFIGMGVDFGIQFCMRYLHETANGVLPDAVIRRTAAGLGAALGLSAMAAAASFFSFIPTDYKGLADLGVIAGAGMFIALAATFTVLPALIKLMQRIRSAPASIPVSASASATSPIQVPNPHENFSHRDIKHAHRVKRTMQARWSLHVQSGTADWIARYAKQIIGIALALMLASLVPTLNLHFDFNPLHLLDASNPAFKAFQSLARESKASPYAIEIIRSDLADADHLAAKIDKLNTVSRVLTLSSLIPDQQQEKLSILNDLSMIMPAFTLKLRRINVPAPDLIAASLRYLQQALEQYSQHTNNTYLTHHTVALARHLADFLHRDSANNKALQALNDNLTDGLAKQIQALTTALSAQRISMDSLPEMLKKRFLTTDGQARIQAFSKLNLDTPGNMDHFVRQIQAVAPDAVGDPVMMVEGGAVVSDAFIQASLLAFAFVTILLIVSLGSFRDCMGVLIPLFLAALLTAAIMQITGLTLNLANIIVLPLLAGLGVSYGIYLALGQRDTGLSGLFQSATPRAVLFSALTTLCSFGSLAISGDTAMMMLGKTLTIALVCVLICVLIVQPALLFLWRKKSDQLIHDV